MKLGEIGENHKISLKDARKMFYVPVKLTLKSKHD